MTAVMTVRPSIEGRPHGAWSIRCRLCPTWTPDCYRTERGARHRAALHLWFNHVSADAPPPLCPDAGRRRYPTKNAARGRIHGLYRAGHGHPDLHPARCTDCHGWHVRKAPKP